jgi:hypothetical protein
MNPQEELFERFGKQLIEWVRDKEIHYADMFLDQEMSSAAKYKAELDGLSPAQRKMLKKMVVRWIDGTIHDVLYLLEDADWIKLRLESDDVVLEDIRRAAAGALQGYVDIWAEKYSTKRLFELDGFTNPPTTPTDE